MVLLRVGLEVVAAVFLEVVFLEVIFLAILNFKEGKKGFEKSARKYSKLESLQKYSILESRMNSPLFLFLTFQNEIYFILESQK